MGSTVTTAKYASAFHATNGALVYVLFEETYSKNTYPHTPNWDCVCVGGLPDVLRFIFRIASACEGGSLQTRSGPTTPEAYLTSWFKALATPFQYGDAGPLEVSLKVDRWFRATVPEEHKQAVTDRIRACSKADIADALLRGEEVSFNAKDEVDLLVRLYGVDGLMGPWRLFPKTSGWDMPEAAYRPTPARKSAPSYPMPRCIKVDENNRLLESADGWRLGGWSYNVVAGFVCDLWEHELKFPGSYRTLIRDYRKSVEDAPSLPERLTVRINRAAVKSEWQQRRLNDLCASLGLCMSDERLAVAVRGNDRALLDALTRLPEAALTWDVDQVETPACVPGSDRQLSLLAA